MLLLLFNNNNKYLMTKKSTKKIEIKKNIIENKLTIMFDKQVFQQRKQFKKKQDYTVFQNSFDRTRQNKKGTSQLGL